MRHFMPEEELPKTPELPKNLFGPSESLFAPPLPEAASAPKAKIFIVHGHKTHLLDELSSYLQREGLKVIILRDELKKGSRTLLEILDELAVEAAYAVVLFTADDEGRKKGDSSWKNRARQNVVFEMGYFFGLLKRDNVCAVFDPDVELPSDLEGVMRIQYAEGGTWKHEVLRKIGATKKDV